MNSIVPYSDDGPNCNITIPWKTPKQSTSVCRLLDTNRVVSRQSGESTNCSRSKQCARIKSNDYHLDECGITILKEQSNELDPSIGDLGGKEDNRSSTFLENNNDRSCEDSSTQTSSSSSCTTLSCISSPVCDSIVDDAVQNHKDLNDAFQMDIVTSQERIWDDLKRRQIAAEAANEALRRRSIKHFGFEHHLHDMDFYMSCYTTTGVGRGSSTVDAIHERDQRPIWKQGFENVYGAWNNCNAISNQFRFIVTSDGNTTCRCPKAARTEKMAAIKQIVELNMDQQVHQREEE